MIMLLDTSTGTCRLVFVEGEQRSGSEWRADRDMARGILRLITDELDKRGRSLQDLTGLGFFRGPGSFTGLRIGASVINTLAVSLKLPVVGESGEDWDQQAILRLKSGEDDRIVLPLYGAEPHITAPRK